MYMQVETRTSTRLHLKRAPGIRSWSLLVGILSTGLAAAYYSGGGHFQQEHWEGHLKNIQPLQEAADSSQSGPRSSGGSVERHPGCECGGGKGPLLWEGLHGGAPVCNRLLPPSHSECSHGPTQ
ncbi:cytochrome b-245 chaperone 1 isoform 2 [Mus musculus]|nr:cytochrome b-245 chaperone 1 isoform 2 [Mus musculus]|eukprot:NP_001239479.1 cytochrome b-245 chaperone 1 isoform 2 [Mus musculus]